MKPTVSFLYRTDIQERRSNFVIRYDRIGLGLGQVLTNRLSPGRARVHGMQTFPNWFLKDPGLYFFVVRKF